MKRFVEGEDRKQVTLLPEGLDDFVAEDNPVRIIDAFVEELELESMGFDGITPSTTGRPSYHPAVQLKIYIYGGFVALRRWVRICTRSPVTNKMPKTKDPPRKTLPAGIGKVLK
ncbi:hypothetical protein ABQJ48_35255, partial [Paraburkholderia sp. DGU8]